jgi:hypothetical protein
MKIKRFNEESMFYEGGQSYKIVEDFIKEQLNNHLNPVDQEDLPNLLIEFGKKVWLHLSAEGWGESSLNGYEEWLNKGSE